MRTATVAIVLGLILCSPVKADDMTTLHVTSVRRDEPSDWCSTGKCIATRFTVDGYRAAKNPNQVIRYVLECVETISTETMKYELICPKVQADGEYLVKLLADGILFP